MVIYDLETLGFDRSVLSDNEVTVTVRCSQCEALVVNGVPTHEHRCPNATFECKGCDARVKRRGAYCENCR